MKKETLSLAVSVRDPKVTPSAVRKAGHVPCVVYGSTKNTTGQCPAKEFLQVFVKAGENTIVEVDFAGKKIPCLIHDVAMHPVTGAPIHIDLYAVDMAKKVTTHVPVILTGESPAVKTQGGILVTVHNQLEVTCLPADLPSEFTIDLASLENFRDSITVAKLKVPAGVTIKTSPETVIVTVQEPRKEEVVEVVAAVPAEGEVPAEGAAAAPGAPGAAPAAGTPAGKADDKAAKAAPAKK